MNARIAWRGLRRRPLHGAAIVLLLAVGIAANAVVFAVTERTIVSPLAVEQPEALVALGRLSYPNYRSFVDRLAGVSGVAAFVNQPLTFTEREPERLRGAFVTADYFRVLGVAAVRGRTFHPADPARVAVISEHFRRTAWGADPEVVGRTLWLNDRAVTIVGVLPGTFQGTTLDYAPHVWVPLALQPEVRPDLADLRENRLIPWVTAFARRLEDEPPGRLRQRVAGLVDALKAEHPRDNADLRAIDAAPLTRTALSPGHRESLVRVLGLLQLAALAVFLVGMANVTILLLASSESRRDEFAVRLTHGARWWRIARQQAGEQLFPAGIAAVGGLAVAGGALHLLARFRVLPSAGAGPWTLALVAGLALAAPFGAWAVSAVRLRRLEAWGAMRSPAVRHGATARAAPTDLFLAVQVTLSLALLCCAMLFADDLRNRMRIDPGFDAENVLRLRISVAEVADEAAAGVLRRTLVSEVAALPGIVDASWGLSIPFGGLAFLTDMASDDGSGPPLTVVTNYVDRRFFSTLGIPFVLGRGFSEGERRRAEVVVSRRLASSLWPAGEPVGRRLRDAAAGGATYEVVGVVGDARYRSLEDELPHVAYFPPDDAFPSGHLVVKSDLPTARTAAAVRERVRALLPGVPIPDTRTLEDVLHTLLERERLVTAGVGAFSGLGLALAAVGLAGTAARQVGRRRREIGVRLALGARPRDVFLMLLRQGGTVLVGGLAGGTALAAGCWRLVRNQLYGVDTAGMVLTLGGAALVLATTGILAVALPARRAMAVEPAAALREE